MPPKEEKDIMGLLREDVGVTKNDDLFKKKKEDPDEGDRLVTYEREDEDDDNSEIIQKDLSASRKPPEKEEEEEEEPKPKEEEEEEGDSPERLTRKKAKKDKPVQIKELRKSRDDERARANKLQQEIEKLRGATSEEAVSLLEFIRENYGELNEDTVDKVRSLAEVEKERDKIKQEFESYKKDRDIRASDEWKNNYETPYRDAVESFYASIANVDSDGEVANRPYFDQLQQSIFADVSKNEGKVNATRIKAIIKDFGQKYEEATGEEYISPPINEVVSTLREVVRRNNAAVDAYQKWETDVQSRQEESKLQSEDRQHRLNLIAKKERRKLAEKAIEEFDFDALDEVFDEQDIENTFNDAYIESEQGMEKPDKAIPYNAVLTSFTKARLFDQLLEKYRELEEQVASRKDRRSLKGSAKIPPKGERSKEPVGSWLGDQNPLSK